MKTFVRTGKTIAALTSALVLLVPLAASAQYYGYSGYPSNYYGYTPSPYGYGGYGNNGYGGYGAYGGYANVGGTYMPVGPIGGQPNFGPQSAPGSYSAPYQVACPYYINGQCSYVGQDFTPTVGWMVTFTQPYQANITPNFGYGTAPGNPYTTSGMYPYYTTI